MTSQAQTLADAVFQGLEENPRNFPSLGKIQEAKTALRARLREALARLTPAERAAAGETAARRLFDLPAFRGARRVALYLALPREMPTAPIIEQCARDGRQMATPAFDAAAGRYRLAEFDPARELRRGLLGVAEPASPVWIEDAPDFWIVPGLAFDLRGGRLGRGAGWYDRLLAGATAPRAGLAFDLQIVEEVPMTAGDMAMDYIITEKQTVVCRQAGLPAPGATAEETAPPGARCGAQERRR